MRAGLFSALLAVTALIWVAAAQEDTAPMQPIPFSHKVHAGTLKLQCKMCHPNPNPGETMTIAGVSTCMQCHTTVRADSPAIQKLAGYAKQDRAVPWARVYQIPSYVSYSHRAHLESGNTC